MKKILALALAMLLVLAVFAGCAAKQTTQQTADTPADAPKSEMTDYVIALRALTQGRGRFTFRVERYEEVPAAIAQKVIDAAKKE